MSTIIDKKITILDKALTMVRQIGFESVSIATLANEVGMSKSGLFAHFNSKEKMHLMILDHAAATFSNEVFRQALKAERGIPRLQLIMKNWVKWFKKDDGGTCPFLAASIEYNSKPGPVKDKIMNHTSHLIKSLEKTIQLCIDEKHFRTELDAANISYEFYSLIIGHLIYLRTIENKSAAKYFTNSTNQLIEKYSV